MAALVRTRNDETVRQLGVLVPVDLHREAKAEAALRGMTLAELTTEALRNTLAGSQK